MPAVTDPPMEAGSSGSPAAAEAAPAKPRAGTRRRTLKAGRIAFNDRHCTLTCTVRDVSETGARLRCEGSISVPDTFDLIIDLDGLDASCEVVWRKGPELGVRFVAPPRKKTPLRAQVVGPVVAERTSLVRRRPSGS